MTHTTYPAPAKINLFLRVTRLRPDGMHELDTAFAFTDLCDTLHISHASDLRVTCSQTHLSGEKNLVHRILSAFGQQHGIDDGLTIHIDKQIPEQAGLGGGSSDAATALMVANQLWQIHASTQALIRFATPFGADIPCFLYRQASRAQGVGEQLQPYTEPLPSRTLLLARPRSGLSTAEVFKHFDRTLTTQPGLDTIRPDSPVLTENDLEASACALNPDVKKLLGKMRSQLRDVWMSGSGSTCVALCDSAQEAVDMADMLASTRLASWTHIGKINGIHPLNIGT